MDTQADDAVERPGPECSPVDNGEEPDAEAETRPSVPTSQGFSPTPQGTSPTHQRSSPPPQNSSAPPLNSFPPPLDSSHPPQGSSPPPQNSLDPESQLANRRPQEEAYADTESSSHELGSTNASLDAEAVAVSGQHFLSSNFHTASDRHIADVAHFFPHMFAYRGEETDHHEELPVHFQFPNADDDDASKVFSCNLCSFKTAFKNSLVNHQAVHSDARPWTCDRCEYAAKRKQDLKKHLQAMHGLVLDSESIRPGMNPAPGQGEQLSPVETKPQIVNGVVISPRTNSSQYETFHLNLDKARSVFPGFSGHPVFSQQQQGMAGFMQPLPSSAHLTSVSRSSVPSVGKFFADKFPFNQLNTNPMSPTASSSCNPLSPTVPSSQLSRGCSGASLVNTTRALPHSSTHDSGHAQSKFRERRDGNESISEDVTAGENEPHSDSTSSQRNTAANETEEPDMRFTRDSHPPVKMEAASSDCRYMSSQELASRSEAMETVGRMHTQSCLRLESSNASDNSRTTRRQISDSTDSNRSPERGGIPAKIARLPSHSSDSDLSPRVTSRSESNCMAEPMSSAVTCSRGLQTRRSFHCPHCDILFFENALYLMHMGLHDNRNPWKCSVCGQTFYEKYSFTSHFINQH